MLQVHGGGRGENEMQCAYMGGKVSSAAMNWRNLVLDKTSPSSKLQMMHLNSAFIAMRNPQTQGDKRFTGGQANKNKQEKS